MLQVNEFAVKTFRNIGVFCVCILLLLCGYLYAAENKVEQIPTVTLTLNDVRVGEIINDVSRQVGYFIRVQGELKDDVLSGKYIDVSLDKFFLRVFKHKNIIVDIDSHEKTVVVHLFGSSDFGSEKDYVTSLAKDDPDSKIALSSVTASELEGILAKEEQIYQEWRNDPNAIIPFTSMTKAKLEKIIDQEAVENQDRNLDPKRKMALSDLKQSEALSILKHEGEKDLKSRQDPKVKIALSDMTQSEYRTKIEDDARRLQGTENAPNAKIPFSNVTYSEFHSGGAR